MSVIQFGSWNIHKPLESIGGNAKQSYY